MSDIEQEFYGENGNIWEAIYCVIIGVETMWFGLRPVVSVMRVTEAGGLCESISAKIKGIWGSIGRDCTKNSCSNKVINSVLEFLL